MSEGVDDRSTQAAERSGGEALSSTAEPKTPARHCLASLPPAPLTGNQCYTLQSMGCVKSKKSNSAAQNANSTEKVDGRTKGTRGERAYLVDSEADSPQVNPVLLEYAQKLSEEIVARAVQQWVEVDRRYGDIPYIECDVP